jgi:hypothetical protein
MPKPAQPVKVQCSAQDFRRYIINRKRRKDRGLGNRSAGWLYPSVPAEAAEAGEVLPALLEPPASDDFSDASSAWISAATMS